ncbi:MAG: HTH domain-containing protein [Methanocorpusculum sp.]|nr:HTH domain-containing protein [Methanocorpusculum sp.]
MIHNMFLRGYSTFYDCIIVLVIKTSIFHLLSKNEDKILEYIKQNPEITQKELTDILGISDRQIRKTILLLKENNIIIRVGSSRKGYWKLETQ